MQESGPSRKSRVKSYELIVSCRVALPFSAETAPIQRQTQFYLLAPERGIARQERNYPQAYSIFPDTYQD
jgi:hypothetical protein